MVEKNMSKYDKIDLFLKIISYIVIGIIIIISVLPLIWVFISSFKTNAEILSGGFTLPKSLYFEGYIYALETTPLIKYFFNSLLIAIISTFMNLLLLGMASYVLARYKFRFKKIIITLLFATLMIPTISIITPIYTMIDGIGLYDTKLGLILVYTAFGIPMSMLILKTYFGTIPKELEEAAKIDGATMLQTYFKIILPISKSAFASAGVLQFLFCWNEFAFALTLTSSDNARTLPMALNFFVSSFSSNYTAMFAAITISVIPSIFMYVLFQKQVVNSMVAGAVKG